MGEVTAAAEDAAAAAADLALADAIAHRSCLDPRCFRRTDTGRCEYHDPANLFEVTVNTLTTRRYLRSLAYAEGVVAEADALDAEVPRIAGQILVDRAPRIAVDGDSGMLGSLLNMIHNPGVQRCTIMVALPPEAAEVYDRAAAATEATRAHLVGIYLDQIALDVIDVRSITEHAR
jgi:hypothetical protein